MKKADRRQAALKAWVTIRARQAQREQAIRDSIATAIIKQVVTRKSKITGNETLLGFIRALGGLNLGHLTGEAKAFRESKAGSRPGLFNKRSPYRWEEMIGECNVAGYGPFEDDRAFFEAIDNETRGLRTYFSSARRVTEINGGTAEDWERHIQLKAQQGCCGYCNRPFSPTEVAF